MEISGQSKAMIFSQNGNKIALCQSNLLDETSSRQERNKLNQAIPITNKTTRGKQTQVALQELYQES